MRSEIELRIADVGALSRPEAPHIEPQGNGGSFVSELGRAIEKVDKMQLEADQEAQKVASGAGNLHEMAIALEKADVAMRLAMKVRNKVVEAYNEIMRMGM